MRDKEIANLARKTTERSFETAFETYMKLKARQQALIPKIAMQKRAWRVELENLEKIDALAGTNFFTLFEVGTHDRK